MTVDQLRDALSTMPGHIPVHVAVPHYSSTEPEYLFTLDCTVESFPSQGRMAVISINEEPK